MYFSGLEISSHECSHPLGITQPCGYFVVHIYHLTPLQYVFFLCEPYVVGDLWNTITHWKVKGFPSLGRVLSKIYALGIWLTDNKQANPVTSIREVSEIYGGGDNPFSLSASAKGISMYTMIFDQYLWTINNRMAKLLSVWLFSKEGQDIETPKQCAPLHQCISYSYLRTVQRRLTDSILHFVLT